MTRARGLLATAAAVVVSTAVLVIDQAPVAANAACTVSHQTTVTSGASQYTYGLIEPMVPRQPCRIEIPSTSNDVSFLVVGGGGSTFDSSGGASGGGGAGGVGVHTVADFPTAVDSDGNGRPDSFQFDLTVGNRDEASALNYTTDLGTAVQYTAGGGGFGGQGGSTGAIGPGAPGGAGEAPGHGGGGAINNTGNSTGGAAGGAGAFAGGDGFAGGHLNDPQATAGGGGGAGGAGADGTDVGPGGLGGAGVNLASVFPVSSTFATKANLPTTIAEGGNGFVMGTNPASTTPSYGSGADALANSVSLGGSGVIIVRYGITLAVDTTKGTNGVDPPSMTDGGVSPTVIVHLVGTGYVPTDQNSPRVASLEWVDSQGQSLNPAALCTSIRTGAPPSDPNELVECTGFGVPTLPVGSYNFKVTMTDGREVTTNGTPFRVTAGMAISAITPNQLVNEGTQIITITGSNLPPSNHPTLTVFMFQSPVGGGGGGPMPPGGPMSMSSSVVSPSSYSDQGHNQTCTVDTSFAGPGIRCSFTATGFYLRDAAVVVEESQGNATGSQINFIPTITSVSPNTGSAAGGEIITITGTGLLNATSVEIGGVAATIDTNANNTRTSLTVITAVSATDGAKDVSVVVPAPTGQDLTATLTVTAVNGITYSFATARTPTFDTPVATADGFTVNVTNHDPAFTWGTPSVTSGSVSVGTPTGSNLPLTVTGLSAGASATITITNSRTGYNAGSGSVQGSAQAAAPTRPDPPTIGQITPGNGQATVTVAQAGTGGTPTSYTVTSSGGQSCQISGASGACTVTGLTNGTAYTFTATATNAVGTSPSSAASSSVTPSTTPGAPTGVSGLIGDRQVVVSWTAPSDTGGSSITGYSVESSVQGSGTWTTVVADTGSTATSYTVTGLTNGTAYLFRVSALNANGSSAPSLPSVSLTPANPPGAPNQPTATAGAGSATVSVSAGTGGTPTSYTVFASPGNAQCTVSGASGSCTLTGLTNGTSYTFTATATNSDGTSAPSVASAAVTPSTIPGNVGVPTALRGDQQVLLSWVAPSDGGSAITGYLIEKNDGTGWSTVTANTNSSSTSYTVTGLTNGTQYSFRVTAINANGSSAAPSSDSNAVTPVSLPGTPSGLTATHGNGQVSLTWTPGSSNAALTGHLVEMSIDGGSTWTTAVADTGSANGSATVTGLANGTSYLFRVSGISSAGTGLPFTIGAAVTPSTTPSSISNLTAVVGDQQVTLNWTAGSNGGSPITGYTIEKNDGTGWTTVTANTNSTSTSHTVTGLTNGTTYDFRVTPINANGASQATSPGLANTVSPIAAPGAPAAPTVVAGPGSATVTVTAGSGGAPSSYTVTALAPNNQTAGTCTVTGASGSCTISGLTPGISYTFTATATNANSTSVSSAASASVTPLAVAGGGTPTNGGTPTSGASTPTSGGGSGAQNAGTVAGGRELAAGGKRPSTPILTSNGAVPQRAKGSVRMLVDGRIEQVDVSRTRSGGLSVGTSEFNLRFEVKKGAGGVVTMDDSLVLTLSAAGTIEVTGSGFVPGSVVDIWLFSEPKFLGMVTVGADGTFAGDLPVPKSIALGDHTLQANGTGTDGEVKSLTLGIEVVANMTRLPATGGDIVLLVYAPWLLFMGALVVVMRRRISRR